MTAADQAQAAKDRVGKALKWRARRLRNWSDKSDAPFSVVRTAVRTSFALGGAVRDGGLRDVLNREAEIDRLVKLRANDRARTLTLQADRDTRINHVLVGEVQQDVQLLRELDIRAKGDRYAEPFDLVVAHNFNSLLTAQTIADRSPTPCTVLFDCVEHPRQVLRTPGRISDYFEAYPAAAALYQRGIEAVIERCTSVMVTSPGHREYLRSVIDCEIELVCNTKRLPVPPASRDIRADAGIGEGQELVLYLNNSYRGAGLVETVQAIGAGPSNRILSFLGGYRDKDEQAEVERLLKTLKLQDRFVHLDLVEPHMITSYVAGADCIVCPFDTEHDGYAGLLPIRVFDAALGRAPLVVTAKGEMDDFVSAHGLGAVFDVHGPASAYVDAMTAAIALKSDEHFSTRSLDEISWTPHAETMRSLKAVKDLGPGTRALVIANKPIRNNSRISNIAHTLHATGAEVQVTSWSEPHPGLEVPGVRYVVLGVDGRWVPSPRVK